MGGCNNHGNLPLFVKISILAGMHSLFKKRKYSIFGSFERFYSNIKYWGGGGV